MMFHTATRTTITAHGKCKQRVVLCGVCHGTMFKAQLYSHMMAVYECSNPTCGHSVDPSLVEGGNNGR